MKKGIKFILSALMVLVFTGVGMATNATTTEKSHGLEFSENSNDFIQVSPEFVKVVCFEAGNLDTIIVNDTVFIFYKSKASEDTFKINEEAYIFNRNKWKDFRTLFYLENKFNTFIENKNLYSYYDKHPKKWVMS